MSKFTHVAAAFVGGALVYAATELIPKEQLQAHHSAHTRVDTTKDKALSECRSKLRIALARVSPSHDSPTQALPVEQPSQQIRDCDNDNLTEEIVRLEDQLYQCRNDFSQAIGRITLNIESNHGAVHCRVATLLAAIDSEGSGQSSTNEELKHLSSFKEQEAGRCNAIGRQLQQEKEQIQEEQGGDIKNIRLNATQEAAFQAYLDFQNKQQGK